MFFRLQFDNTIYPTGIVFFVTIFFILTAFPFDQVVMLWPPGGGLPYESDGDARRKIRIKPLKETNLGVVQALFDP